MKVLNLCRPVIGAVAASLCLGYTAPVQAQVGNPSLIPATSAYVVSVPDTKALWNAWKGNAIYESYKKVMEDPEIAEKLGSFNKELKTIEDVLGYKLDGETMSSVFKNADIYVGPGENAGSHSAGAVLGVADKDKLNKLLDLGEKAAAAAVSEAAKSEADDTKSDSKVDTSDKPAAPAKSGSKATPAEKDGMGGADDTETTKSDKASGPISSENYSGVTVKRFASGEDNEVYYAIAGDLLLLSNDRGEMKALVDRSKNSAGGSTLQASEGYKKISTALSSRKGEVYLFGSQKEAMEMQQGGSMDALREITKQLSPVDSYGSSVKIEPKQISHYSYGILSTDTSSSLLQKHPGDKPLQAIGYVPAETLLAFATSLVDSELIYKLVTDAAGAAGNKSLDEQLKAAEGMIGFSVQNDFIPALGNEMALAVNSVQFGGNSPAVDAALVFGVRDKAKMQKVLDAVEKLASASMANQAGSVSEPESSDKGDKGGAEDEPKGKKTAAKKSGAAKEQPAAFKQLKVGEATIHYTESPSLFGLTPGYVLDGDFLVIGSTKEAIQSAMQVKSGNKGLAESEAVKALGPRITTTGNIFQYFNFTGIWTTADMFAKTMLNPTLAKGYEAIKVLKTAAGVSSVKDGAVVSEGVLLLQ
ncbi:MAG: DUF3352 domain-containing protein [Candidatus Sumerlaeaceae bacterium]